MELRVVIRQLGFLMFVLAALIAAVALFAVYERLTGRSPHGADLRALSITAFVGFFFGGLLYVAGRRTPELFGHREAMLLVAASWLLGAALAALPYRLWSAFPSDAGPAAHDFDTYVNCYFEAMSGLTTTGATVVQATGALPRSLLLWRALTQWLGGLGIVVLFVAVFPLLGVGSRRLYRVEAPGPSPQGVRPRIRDTARILWLIYLGLTVAEVLALRLCGMGWFDAVCHTFATLATGGFSTQDSSIAAYPSAAVHVVVIIFMILAGINFGLYHQLLQRQWDSVKKDPELRLYLTIILVATVIVTISLLRNSSSVAASTGEEATLGTTVRHSLFQVISIQTTTGFCSADFDLWGFAAKATLLILMFIGASAGSTGGGIKVMRIMIAAKVLLAEIEHVYRPKVVRPVKIGKAVIEPELKLNTLVYVLGIALLFAVGTVLIMLLETANGVDITSAASAAAATLNNIGPGLARVGATQDYAWFTASSKLVMSILMLLGRLEMFTIIVLFTPRFWRTQ
ncbi:MAG: TrkH family potassium uptake protein [Phycisphaerales bacterium]|nr:MAG: TrkH family potassium uptake protein [Phycisphaerales bacterium]